MICFPANTGAPPETGAPFAVARLSFRSLPPSRRRKATVLIAHRRAARPPGDHDVKGGVFAVYVDVIGSVQNGGLIDSVPVAGTEVKAPLCLSSTAPARRRKNR